MGVVRVLEAHGHVILVCDKSGQDENGSRPLLPSGGCEASTDGLRVDDSTCKCVGAGHHSSRPYSCACHKNSAKKPHVVAPGFVCFDLFWLSSLNKTLDSLLNQIFFANPRSLNFTKASKRSNKNYAQLDPISTLFPIPQYYSNY
jgi:hypothetical protein